MKDNNWWKYGIFYHVYVRSFFDSNGDGIGDIPGITLKLDYLKMIGVRGIWLSPIFKSPHVDFGYDIADYKSIDPDYGTMKDLKKLIEKAHKKEISVILDIALNHTSDRHPWFIESRSSRNNPKRDWYIWGEGRFVGPPNNWITGLLEPAWSYDHLTGEYYLHSFLKNQPDLNWRNKEVKKQMLKVLKFWMKRGIDGFRLDMVNWLIKDKKMRNNPNFLFFKIFQIQIYNKNQKRIAPLLNKIRKTTEKYPGRVTVGEVFTMPPGDPKLSAYFLGDGKNSLNMAFDFSLMYRYWSSRGIFKAVKKWLDAIPPEGWPCHVLSNHDQKRSFNRLCRGKDGIEKAKILIGLLLTLPGTPFVYYGEEIGMKNFNIPRKQILDPIGIKFWPFFRGRDSSRSPMQWNPKKNAGFSKAEKTWLPVNPEFPSNNVISQLSQKNSLLQEFITLSKLRSKSPSLYKGSWQPLQDGKKGLIAYFRKRKHNNFLIAMNFRNSENKINERCNGKWKCLYSSKIREISQLEVNEIILKPFEFIILKQVS